MSIRAECMQLRMQHTESMTPDYVCMTPESVCMTPKSVCFTGDGAPVDKFTSEDMQVALSAKVSSEWEGPTMSSTADVCAHPSENMQVAPAAEGDYELEETVKAAIDAASAAYVDSETPAEVTIMTPCSEPEFWFPT